MSFATAKWEEGWFSPTGRDWVLGLLPHSNLGRGRMKTGRLGLFGSKADSDMVHGPILMHVMLVEFPLRTVVSRSSIES
jgi:hypothetical protein